MCQFRLDQPIPRRSHQLDQLHSVTLSDKTDNVWHIIQADYFHRWDRRMDRIQQGTPLVTPLTSTSNYMKWYRRITRRWIGRSSASLGQVVDMIEQLHISSSTPPPNFTFAGVHQATTDILEVLREHDRTLLQQISQPAPPSQTFVQPPLEEVEKGGSRAGRRRIGLAANRTTLCYDEPSSSSNHGTQSSTPAPTGPPPSQPPQQHFPPASISVFRAPARPASVTLEALLRFAPPPQRHQRVPRKHQGGACRVHASTWMAPSLMAPPSQHLKKGSCHRGAT
ncbi:hypothetical protein PIB30_003581 [Stylosanthes scabra]|uniref:Serine/threonine-protein phosphatase 7 long form-like n=1 Tax=Stylosanthes scabra TaxID=79078 RepID=A0ABU6X591_9FABA|nr:hypothetical protein [Stylosanthes scabra]